MATMPDLTNGWQAGAPTSAMLAMRTHHAVQRFACLACMQEVIAPENSLASGELTGDHLKAVWG